MPAAGNVKAVDARFFKLGSKERRFMVGIAVWHEIMTRYPDYDREVRSDLLTYSFNHVNTETAAVFPGAAVLIGALVG